MAEETNQPNTAPKAKKPGGLDGLIAAAEPYFTEKAPFQLPEGVRTWIADYAWIISLVIGLLSLPAVLGLLALGGFVGAVAASYGVSVGLWYWLSFAALVIQIGFLFWAVPGLKNKSYAKGWKIVLYSELFSFAYSVFSLTVGSVFWGIISLLIGLYFLFQVKSKFN